MSVSTRPVPMPRREQRVHLNTAGVGRMPEGVRALLTDYARREDRFGPWELEEEFADVLYSGIHDRLGGLLAVPAADTVLATSAAAAFEDLLSRLPLDRSDRIWTTPYESAAGLGTLYALRDRARCKLEVVPLREDGDLDLDWMAARIDDGVALVSVAHVPSGYGIVNPVEEVGRLLAPYRCLYAVDASHSVGQLPVDAGRIGCHLLTGDGWRFLRGPQGIGFAYTGERLRQALAPGEAEPRVRPENAAVVALDSALAHHAAAAEQRADLLPELRAAAEAVPGIEVIAPGRVQSGLLGFRHPELPAALIRRRLAEQGVIVWKTVAQETPLLPVGGGANTVVRASVHHDNGPEDIARFGEALSAVVAEELSRLRAVPRELPGARPAGQGGRRLRLCPAS
ncbi:aminotransferase class V-fold PLP-dependent enzyme [Kitasatospora sp. NPDC006697]|uniref:aminotransferase class V-fold PLP-dependent enzyme n=1 Tax=Kitasatospora sp. NPDC006697 TaxID=3364020 RepID=UPI003699E5E1